MKKLLLLLAPLTLGLMIGCSYDDSAILDKIAEMEKEHDEMQAQIATQQTILDALANKLTITAVTQTDNGNTITFSDGTSMSIKDGEQGEKGEDGDSFIESIVVGDEDVTFTLADGTVIVIPLGSGGSSDGGEPSAEDNKIYYTTSNGKKLFPSNIEPTAFGAILVSNTYEDGQGVLIFDDTITSIGNGAFMNYSSLTEITIPNSVTSIGNGAFYGCSSLTSVTIGNGVTSIGYRAFYNCSSLTSVTIPDSVTEIGEDAFYGCSSLTSITISDSVTSIGNSAFEGCSSLTSITIPDSVTSIGSSAFEGCSSLTSITIPDSVTEIGNSAFKGCTSLPIENNIRYADTYVVEVTNNTLTSYTLKENVRFIGTSAFSGCTSLTNITIPNSVTSIGNDAFRNCTSLTSVHITDVAAWCGIIFSNGDANPLGYAHNLYLNGELVTDLVIPDSVTSIGNSAFSYCTSLTSVTIPDSVTSIGNSAFSYCTSLTSVTIGNGVTSIGSVAFGDCTSLTSITIPDSVTSIGNAAFEDCSSLTSITIPDSVTEIGSYAFRSCTSLKKVYCKATTPPAGGEYMFNNNASGRRIYVPTESVDAYKAAWYWRDYDYYIVGYDFE